MGYVYSPRQIERGEVATPESFGIAYEILQDGLKKGHEQGFVIGAKIHGGYEKNEEETVGGDIDVLLVTGSIDANNFLAELYRRIWKETWVPVEFIPYLRENAEKGLHYIDHFFFEYLKEGEGIFVGDNPLEVIKKDTSVSPETTIKKKFDSYIRRIGNWMSQVKEMYDEDHCKLLECAIRWPVYTALDMLRLKLGSFPRKDGSLMGKSDICEKYRKEFSDFNTERLFLSLGLRKRYRNMINNPSVNMEDYTKLLGEIDSSLGPVYFFITENDAFLAEGIRNGDLKWREKD